MKCVSCAHWQPYELIYIDRKTAIKEQVMACEYCKTPTICNSYQGEEVRQ